MKTLIQSAIVLSLLTFWGCSAERKLAKRLEGDWQVVRYESENQRDQGVALSNIGSFTFYDRNRGEQNITYSGYQNSFPSNRDFRWSNTAEYVTLENALSRNPKSWIIVENKKSYQKWKSTDGSTGVQVLELRRTGSKEPGGFFGNKR
jgi:hypothetical protein